MKIAAKTQLSTTNRTAASTKLSSAAASTKLETGLQSAKLDSRACPENALLSSFRDNVQNFNPGGLLCW